MASNFGRGDTPGAVDYTSPDVSRDVHLHDDIDSGPRAHHHTLGTGVNQAYPGNKGQVLEDRADENLVVDDMMQLWSDDMHSIDRWIRQDELAAGTTGLTDGSWGVVEPVDSDFGRYNFQTQKVYHAAYHQARIPFDPLALYRIRVRVRTMTGAPMFYAGVRPYGFANANVPGALPSGNWYGAVAATVPPVGPGYTEYVGYLRGYSAGGSVGVASIESPGTLPLGTTTFSPMMLPGFAMTAADSLQVSMYKVEVFDPVTNVWSLVNGANYALVATAVTDIPTCTTNINVHSPKDVYLVDVNFDVQNSTAAALFAGRLVVDGAAIGGEIIWAPQAINGRSTVSASRVVTGLAAGARTFKLAGRQAAGAGPTTTVFGGSTGFRVVRVA